MEEEKRKEREASTKGGKQEQRTRGGTMGSALPALTQVTAAIATSLQLLQRDETISEWREKKKNEKEKGSRGGRQTEETVSGGL